MNTEPFDRDFETMLRFKAGAGIAPLCAWVRELYVEMKRENDELRKYLDGTREAEVKCEYPPILRGGCGKAVKTTDDWTPGASGAGRSDPAS